MIVYILKELVIFLEFCKKYGNMKIEIYFCILVYIGVRKFEIFVLEWNDINFDNNKLIISKILVEVEYDLKFKKIKVVS